MLSADSSRYGEELADAEKAGADAIHWDIADGVFTDAITFGHQIVKDHRKLSSLRFDVHLMIENPDKHLENFARAGADVIIVHPETCKHLHRTLLNIKSLGLKSGAALNPATPVAAVEYCVDILDTVTVMSVNPGASGREFIDSQLKKISELKKMLPPSTEICADGGITDLTIKECAKRGANSFVSGSYIFRNPNRSDAVRRLREACG
jgi:ribulose-phosphate 3-epimerase